LDVSTGESYNTAVTYKDSGGNAVQSTTKDYTPPFTTPWSPHLPLRLTTNLPSGVSKKVEYSYDSLNYGNISEVREWDYYSGTAPSIPSRIIDATYTAANASYVGPNIISKPTTVALKDGYGRLISETSYEYDYYTEDISYTGAPQHDGTYNTGH